MLISVDICKTIGRAKAGSIDELSFQGTSTARRTFYFFKRSGGGTLGVSRMLQGRSLERVASRLLGCVDKQIAPALRTPDFADAFLTTSGETFTEARGSFAELSSLEGARSRREINRLEMSNSKREIKVMVFELRPPYNR